MNEWNSKEHDVYWNRHENEDGTWLYRLMCDGKQVYFQEIDPRGMSTFVAMQKHHAFLDLVDEYRSSGQLPGRSARGILKKTIR